MARWLWIVLALAACRNERSHDRPRNVPAVKAVDAPPPVRIELGECGGIKPFLVGVPAPSRIVGQGCFHEPRPGNASGQVCGQLGRSVNGRIVPVHMAPSARLDSIETVATFKPALQREVKRVLLRIEYCYQKRLLVRRAFEGALDMQLKIAADGKLAAPVAFVAGADEELVSCVQKALDTMQLPAPPQALDASVRVMLKQGDDPTFVGQREPTEPMTVPNPLRSEDLAACVQQVPTAIGTYVFDVSFSGDTVKQVEVHGGTDPNGCIAALVRKVKAPAGAPAELRLRCSFAFGVDAPQPAAIIKLDERGVLRYGEGEITVVDLARIVRGQRVVDRVMWRGGPIQLQVEPAVLLGEIWKIVRAIEEHGAGVVFVMPHVLGGPPRFLGRTLPGAPQAEEAWRWVAAQHSVRVGTNGITVDDRPMRSWDELAARLRELRATSEPRIDVTFDGAARFGDFAHVVDVVVAAGFSDWRMVH